MKKKNKVVLYLLLQTLNEKIIKLKIIKLT